MSCITVTDLKDHFKARNHHFKGLKMEHRFEVILHVENGTRPIVEVLFGGVTLSTLYALERSPGYQCIAPYDIITLGKRLPDDEKTAFAAISNIAHAELFRSSRANQIAPPSAQKFDP